MATDPKQKGKVNKGGNPFCTMINLKVPSSNCDNNVALLRREDWFVVWWLVSLQSDVPPDITFCCSLFQIRMDRKAFVYSDQLNAWYTVPDNYQLSQKTLNSL